VGEPRRRGSLFSRPHPAKRKGGHLARPKTTKAEFYSIPAWTTWTMLLRTA
jgi:hypothetical protein